MKKPEMRLENPMVEDSFEQARKAFFGTGKTAPKLSVSSSSFPKDGESALRKGM